MPLNPNGTYIANTHPQGSAAYGAQGGYGSGLPQVQVQTQFGSTPLSVATQYGTGPSFLQQVGAAQNLLAGQNFQSPYGAVNVGYAPYGVTNAPTVPKITQTAAPPSIGTVPTNYNVSQRGRGFQNAPVYSQSQGHPDPGLIQRIAENPEEFNSLSPAQQDAVGRLLEQSAQGGGGGSDFENTKFMQENAQNNVAFVNQLRWDPKRKKYVQIGKLIGEGRLDKYGRLHKKGFKKGGIRSGSGRAVRKQEQAAAAASGSIGKEAIVAPTLKGFTGSYGVVNFNTATG